MSSPVSVTGIVYFFEPNSGATFFATHHNKPSHPLLEPAQTRSQPERKKARPWAAAISAPTLFHHTYQLGDTLLPPPGITRATTTEDSGAGQDVEAAPLLDSFQPYGQGTASMFV